MRQNVPLLVKDASGLTMLDAEHPVDLAGNFVADLSPGRSRERMALLVSSQRLDGVETRGLSAGR